MGENRFGRRKIYLKHKEFVLNLWNHTPQGRRIGVSRYTIGSAKLPAAFEGFRIVQISDIHGKEFGKKQHKLLGAIRKLKPDLILITGDIVQEFYEKKQRSAMVCLLDQVPSIAPSYMILGNHETRSPYLEEVLSDIENSDVELLRNEGRWLEWQGERLYLYGLETGTTSRIASNRDDQQDIETILQEARDRVAAEIRAEKDQTDTDEKKDENAADTKKESFWILMAHKPENFLSFRETGMDLVFSGHAHGGFMKMPGRRLIAPGQGFFPTYTHGLYQQGETRMVVSQGLGGPRFGVEPELVLAVLHPLAAKSPGGME